MIPDTPTIIVPMKMDADGNIRISGTRVMLDTLIAYYKQGQTPEELHESFDTVPLEDVYAVITYYLAHREALDAYLKQREEEGERLRREIEASYTPEQRARHERLLRLVEEKRREKPQE